MGRQLWAEGWLAAVAVAILPQQQVLTPTISNRHGAIACENEICSRAGLKILEQGGTAADAFVATSLCVGVVGSYHSGIGGGGFALIRDGNGNKTVVDYRETAPAAASQDMYKNDERASRIGALAVGIPGELRGLEYVHERYGILPWESVVQPAVNVARNGFVVKEDIHRYLAAVLRSDAGFLHDDPAWAADWAPNGTLVGYGDVVTMKRLANTLEIIGQKGADEFYQGEIAQSIIDTVQANGGILTLDDLKSYRVQIKEPLSIDYRGFKVFTTNAPSSGAVTLDVLKILEQFPPKDVTEASLTLHRLTEAMKFSYGARMELGDPDHVDSVYRLQGEMLSEKRAKQVRGLIKDNETLPLDEYNPKKVHTTPSHGTSHIVVADGSGLTITATTTVNLLFGAEMITPDTGIILNNEQNDFSIPGLPNAFGFPPSPANFIRPGKRSLSSCTPTLVEHPNGTLVFAVGASGGSRIISATAQVLWRFMELGMGLVEALAAPRVHDQLFPTETWLERGFEEGVFEELRRMGHKVVWVEDPKSAVQGVVRLWDGRFEAAGEPRQKNSGGVSF